MIRIYVTIMLLAAGSAWADGERKDGCSAGRTTSPPHVQTVSGEARDRGLMGAGYTLTRDSVISALSDPMPEVRSLAALRLSSSGQGAGETNTTHMTMTGKWLSADCGDTKPLSIGK